MKYCAKWSAVAVSILSMALAAAAQEGGAPRGGRGGFGPRLGMGSGNSVMGTVTEAAADRFTVKTYLGETYVVRFSASTRFVKMPAGAGGGPGRGEGMRRREARQDGDVQAPSEIKPAEIKVGDDIDTMGATDAEKKVVDATAIVQMNPARAQAMRTMMEGFGKTWLMGRVVSVDGTKIEIECQADGRKHTLAADENTALRKRREPVTLADIQTGEMIRAEGSVKDGVFTATTINAMALPQGGPAMLPRNTPPASQQ